MQRLIHLEEGQRQPRKNQIDAGKLIEFAEQLRLQDSANAQFTIDDLMLRFGWGDLYCYQVIRQARLQLAHYGKVTLSCQPQGARERWAYELTDEREDVREYGTIRQQDTRTRIETILAVHRPLEQATDGRTVEGKRVRVVVRHLTRLLEDLDEIDIGVAL